MKWKEKDPYLKAAITVLITGAALMCLNRIFQSVDDMWRSIQSGFGNVVATLSPFIWALVIAYLLRPLRSGLVNLLHRLFPKVRKEKLKVAAVALALVLMLLSIASVIAVLVPAIWNNLMDLIDQIPWYFDQAAKLLEQAKALPFLADMDLSMEQMEQQMLEMLRNMVTGSDLSHMAGQVVATVGGVFSGVITFVLSLVLCVYMLNSGRELLRSIRRGIGRLMGTPRTDRLADLIHEIDDVIGQYIGGKMIQCCVMFVVSLLVFWLLGVPYAPLMAVIMAVSNLIPYIGPVLGGVIPVFFALLIDPLRAVLVLAAVLLIQQVDNYLVEPRLIGDRMGMHPFWVIGCVIVGGDLLGIFGILLAVPLAGVLRICARRYFERRERKKAAAMEAKKSEAGTGN